MVLEPDPGDQAARNGKLTVGMYQIPKKPDTGYLAFPKRRTLDIRSKPDIQNLNLFFCQFYNN